MKMAQPDRKRQSFDRLCFFCFSSIYCVHPLITVVIDCCLELSKIKALKMLDLEKKSAINSNNLQV
jgi:hypothetical protein